MAVVSYKAYTNMPTFFSATLYIPAGVWISGSWHCCGSANSHITARQGGRFHETVLGRRIRSAHEEAARPAVGDR